MVFCGIKDQPGVFFLSLRNTDPDWMQDPNKVPVPVMKTPDADVGRGGAALPQNPDHRVSGRYLRVSSYVLVFASFALFAVLLFSSFVTRGPSFVSGGERNPARKRQDYFLRTSTRTSTRIFLKMKTRAGKAPSVAILVNVPG